MELLREKGARVAYSDPYFPMFPKMREHDFNLRSQPCTPTSLRRYDVVLIATNHALFDYAMVKKHARLIVDTRGVYQKPATNLVIA